MHLSTMPSLSVRPSFSSRRLIFVVFTQRKVQELQMNGSSNLTRVGVNGNRGLGKLVQNI